MSLDEYEHLLEPHELAELGPPEAVRLPLDLVDPNPRNPRGALPEVDLLAENIMRFGLLQPIVVRRAENGRYELLGGHRRLAAFQMLRDVKNPVNIAWRTIPAVVTSADDDRAYLMLISGQVHNRNWRPREEANALERLALAGLTLKQIGEQLNRTEGWASKRLRVYADSLLSGFVQAGLMTSGVAEELLILSDADVKRDLAERAATEQWTQHRARAEVRALHVSRQISEIGRQAKALLQLLSTIEPSKLPLSAAEDLNLLRRRIVALSRSPVIPTIAEAQRAAGVKSQDKPTRKRRAGYRPKL